MMKTIDFPQADRLETVGEVAIAVSKGKHQDKEIENYIKLNSVGRQGRYYRHAAELLGLVLNQSNHSELTPLGQEFVSLQTEGARYDFLARCLLETPTFRGALSYINKHKPTDDQLRVWFRSFYPGSPKTANRRFSTFLKFLIDADLIRNDKSIYQVKKYLGAVVKEIKRPQIGLIGKKIQIKSTRTISSASGSIKYEMDAIKRERANQNHWKLITAKSASLASQGLPAFENEFIDLYTEYKNDIVIYEMKSVSLTNLISQIRKALAQLYEYRYIFSVPHAKLCIVTNAEITKRDAWLHNYLFKDRFVAYEWSRDFNKFYCSADSRGLLKDFSP